MRLLYIKSPGYSLLGRDRGRGVTLLGKIHPAVVASAQLF